MSMKIYADAQKFANSEKKTKLQRHDLPKYIKGLMKTINNKAFSDDETALTDALKESIGLLSGAAQGAKNSFSYRKRLPFSNGKPFVYSCVKNYMKKADFGYHFETFCEYMSVICEKIEVENYEINLLLDAVVVSILEKIAYFCNAENNDTGNDFLVQIRICLSSLKKCAASDANELYRALSKTEKLFENDPVYLKSSNETKNIIRGKLYEFAKENKISEIFAARMIFDEAKEKNTHIGEMLFSYKKDMGGIYFLLLFSVFSALYAVFSLIFGINIKAFLIGILLILPIYDISKQIVSPMLKKYDKYGYLPRLRLEYIPDGAKTLVIVTTLLQDDDKIFERIEDFYLQNEDKNLYVGILGDFVESNTKTCDSDEKILQYTKRRIDALNKKYNGAFCLFYRERERAKNEEKYFGWERKRGAVIEICRYLRGKSCSVKFFGENKEKLLQAKYLLTLDADTNLNIDAVKEMVGIMEYPSNKPQIDEKTQTVKAGHAIIQPKMSVSLTDAAQSYFSLLFGMSGGVDVYAHSTYDLYQNLFDNGSFCGKGMLNIDAFLEVCDTKFETGKILSHDLPEGNLLRSAFVGDITLTDGTPKSASSYYTRYHRWTRGDTQNLIFLKKYIKNQHGIKTKNHMNYLGKYKILDNFLRALLPIFTLIAVFSSLLIGKMGNLVCFFALAYIFYPFIHSLIENIFSPSPKSLTRRFFSFALPSIWQVFVMMIYKISALANEAYVSFDAIIRSVWRMNVSKKRLLEWTTAYQGDKKSKNSLFGYIKSSWFSIVIGIFALLLPSPFIKILAIFWIIFPIVEYCLGMTIKSKREISTAEKKLLKKYVSDTWGYYRDFVNEKNNYLPPDNYQLSPVEAVALRTSPTNIGLYLLSCVAAKDFGIIEANELIERIENTLQSIKKLPLWHGHLYNWYDISTMRIIGEAFVSTVDSGNFLVSLIAVEEALKEICDEYPKALDIIKDIEEFINSCDMRMLYNKTARLFYIGYNAQRGIYTESCYDTFMSESRMTSYFAVARHIVSKEHFRKLGRRVIYDGGYIGIASWSGTAFEYFMPTLLLPVYRNSLTFEALAFAKAKQTEHCQKRVINGKTVSFFGTSESGYFDFDSEMNYQYKAFGAPKLAISTNDDCDVVSPYSSFLMMKCETKEMIKNLENIRKIGGYGKYGFYEAIDFSEKRVGMGYAVVKSQMAHHVGMSIISSANAVFDDIFVRRFMRNEKMRSAKELLKEKIPVDAPLFKHNEISELPKKAPFVSHSFISNESENLLEPTFACLSNNKSKIIASSSGHISLYDGKNALTYPDFDKLSPIHSLKIYAQIDGEIYPFAPLYTENGDICDFSFKATDEYILYNAFFEKNHKKIRFSVKLTLSGDKSVFGISCTFSKNVKNAKCMLYFEPVIMEERAFLAHSAFYDLSIETEYKDGALIFKRRQRDKEGNSYLAVNSNASLSSYQTRKDKVFDINYTDENIRELLKKRLDGDTGIAIFPVCIAQSNGICDMNKDISFYISYSKNMDEAIKNLGYISKADKGYSILEKSILKISRLQSGFAAYPKNKGLIKALYKSYFLEDYSRHSLNFALLYKIKEQKIPESFLYAYSISGDNKILLLETGIPSSEKMESFIEYLRIFKLFMIKNIRFDLVVIYEESDIYFAPVKKRLMETVVDEALGNFIGKNGGIFFIPKAKISSEMQYLLRRISFYNADICDEYKEERPSAILSKAMLVKEKRIERFENQSVTLSKDGVNIKKGISKRTQSHILANYAFGTLLTADSLGFTFLGNSREMKITPHSTDNFSNGKGERLFLRIRKSNSSPIDFDLCKCARSVDFRFDGAYFNGEIEGIAKYKISVCVDEKLFIKYIKCDIELLGNIEDASIFFAVKPILCDREKSPRLIFYESDYENKIIKASTLAQGAFSGKTAFTYYKGTDSDIRLSYDTTELLSDGKISQKEENAAITEIKLSSERLHSLNFALCCAASRENYLYILDTLEKSDFTPKMHTEIEKMLSVFEIGSCPSPLANMQNSFLPYQAFASRVLAKCGFYQVGGAYGFRDQLQDITALVYLNPKLAKRHILRCAAHQFQEGDVQHWWHQGENIKNKGHKGIRSRCSDDFLWLPYAVAHYVKVTGDTSILDIKVRYISSPPLSDNEHERYEIPEKSVIKESVYMHCIRALENAFDFGMHNLPLIKTCDWNDGMNRVGIKGMGESVWLGWFLILTIRDFIEICEIKKDLRGEKKYRLLADKLFKSVECYANDGKWYIRGFYDDMTPLGSKNSDECKIDAISQAFAAFLCEYYKNVNIDTVKMALKSAAEYLFDEEYSLFKLLYPPFDKTQKDPGYIKGYCKGVRENGGQYTHAAVWSAIAFLKINDNEMGYRILRAINPAFFEGNYEKMQRYGGEIYVLAGDVMANDDHYGECGWSWYTGAAGWYFRAVLEELLGYSQRGEYFTLSPRLSRLFDGFSFKINKNETVYNISVSLGNESALVFDGKRIETNPIKIKEHRFYFDKGTHEIKISVKK